MNKEKKTVRTVFLKHLKDSMDRQKERERKSLVNDIVKQMKDFLDNLPKLNTVIKEYKKGKQKRDKEKLEDFSRMYL